MSTDERNHGRIPEPEAPDEPAPDGTPAEPGTPTVPDVPPGPAIPDVPPIEPEPETEPGPVGSGVRAPTIEEITGYTRDGVPTLDTVRAKIERRSATAIGAEELARDGASGRSLEDEYEARQAAAADKLAEIRRSLRSE